VQVEAVGDDKGLCTVADRGRILGACDQHAVRSLQNEPLDATPTIFVERQIQGACGSSGGAGRPGRKRSHLPHDVAFAIVTVDDDRRREDARKDAEVIGEFHDGQVVGAHPRLQLPACGRPVPPGDARRGARVPQRLQEAPQPGSRCRRPARTAHPGAVGRRHVRHCGLVHRGHDENVQGRHAADRPKQMMAPDHRPM
jgi:hypothetical protein